MLEVGVDLRRSQGDGPSAEEADDAATSSLGHGEALGEEEEEGGGRREEEVAEEGERN